ncbi:NAD(P)-dependent oxidoreductase [Hoyosella altamirensis]|uniref:Uncharacterized protein YbjT (DUF2867 family) n=1 Tax=Hoyosella altamirensis TaxID=616997 RepID=A0A839RJL4_9ACTN|nr:NAD(P)-binding oxidoreductase [Hoyosella altamirensis]MBB3037022.1 uncharacterized protein YbjT (DUF2867 family) [Hoyosella altamirensis]
MKILVAGATGGSGRAVVTELLARGHAVTALARHASALTYLSANGSLRTIDGDVTDPSCVRDAVQGQDAVVVTLGISENPVRVRLLGPKNSAPDVRSRGTRILIEAMRTSGVSRLIVQSTYGAGETAGRLRWVDRLFYELLIKPQVADHEKQESIVRASALDWVIVQPVHLNDQPSSGNRHVSTAGEVASWVVPRADVATVIADAAENPAYVGSSVAVSAE